jgi:glycerophosphoryl diester phosphodiesterase
MIAHRGGNAAGKYTENTLEAFQAAWQTGYRYVETDAVLAASGEIVLIHGAQNHLHASVSRAVSRQALQLMTLEQMRQVLTLGAQVPTLKEALAAFPKMKFIVDLKTDEAAMPLAKLIKSTKSAGRLCVTGFSYRRNMEFKKACGGLKVQLGLTVGRGLRFKNMNMFLLKSGRLGGVEAIFLHHSLVSTPMINLVHRRGFKAIVWTANSPIGIRHATRSGADGIISDNIQLLKEILKTD